MRDCLRIHPIDNVAVALHPLKKGSWVEIDNELSILLTADIPQGHKFALCDLPCQSNVVKYGFPIGHTLENVEKGGLVDHNNLTTNLSGTIDYSDIKPTGKENSPVPTATFMGYRRSDGQVGIRNEVWIVPTVGCVNGICRQIAERARTEIADLSGIDAINYFPHNYGCSQLSEDHENTRHILRDIVLHPNAGAVLVVGLGCENNQPHDFEALCGNYDHNRIRFMVCQEIEGDEVEAGIGMLRELVHTAQSFRREPVPLSALRIGLKCGGSDGFSGITANPLLGVFTDYLCMQEGGTAILTEVPEMFGAETILMQRCISDEVLQQSIRLINNFKDYFIAHGEPIGENPSPGNKAGGISTLEEKSLGCTQKAGTAPVCGVLSYGERLSKAGLHLLSAPGNDLVASTALAAAGCQLVLFTTGRGTPFSTFVPTLKISTNSDLARRKPQWIDFDAGRLLTDTPMPQLLQQFTEKIIAVASGESKTLAETHGNAEIAIFKTGVTL